MATKGYVYVDIVYTDNTTTGVKMKVPAYFVTPLIAVHCGYKNSQS